MSWVTLDRICQERVDKDGVRLELVRNGRPLRSSADSLSDDELLAKLRDLGLDVDRDGVERLCAGALSAEEVARPIVDKLKLDDMTVNWVWISLLALWQRWWPDRPGLELLDDKMQAGYAQDAENDTHAAVVTWLDAWSDVLRLCDATGIGSIEEFDDRFPLSQSLFNWSQDLEMALENAGRDNREIRQSLIEFCEESFRRFPREDQLLTENRRRTMAEAFFDAGMTEKSEELFRSWLDADPAWGWGWIGWADCYLPGPAGRRTWPGRRSCCAAVTASPVSGTGFTSRSDCKRCARTAACPTKPGSSASRPNDCGMSRSARPPGRARAWPGTSREGSRWGAMPRALAAAGRSSRNAAVPPQGRGRGDRADHGLLPAASRTEDHGGLRLPVGSREDQFSGRRHRSWRRADGDSACGSA